MHGRTVLLAKSAAVGALIAGTAGLWSSCDTEEDQRPAATGAGPRGRSGSDEGTPALSSLVAFRFQGVPGSSARDFKEYVVERVGQFATSTLPSDVDFPLPLAGTDTLRSLAGTKANVVVRWLEPLNFDPSVNAPRFGANADYTAYFGDGWAAMPGNPPQWNGSPTRGWLWVNHEYISNLAPSRTTAPTGQHLVYARFLRRLGLLNNDVDSPIWHEIDRDNYIKQYKRQLGGSWMRVFQDPSTGDWTLDRSARNVRYDATTTTLARLTGYMPRKPEVSDVGVPLRADVVGGTAGNCSGGQTPWGTIITAEENVQSYYGDLESAWSPDQRFIPAMGFDPGGPIQLRSDAAPVAEFVTADPLGRHAKDTLGWLTEIDPGVAPGEFEGKTMPGVGHKKLGALGRARWENAAFVTGADWKMLDGKPMVMYAADDRLGGRIYKFVSSKPWSREMTKAQTRALLDEGALFVSHFAGLDNARGDKLLGDVEPTEAAPGQGRWIRLSLTSTDRVPNGQALGAPDKTVGDALKDPMWNGIGAFPTEDDVRLAMFTATNKIGVVELNRPEDVEWNPRDPSGTPRLYVAFTNHTRQVALDQEGRVFPTKDHPMMSPRRADEGGSIFALQEERPADPAASSTFRYFVAWRGTKVETGSTDVHAAANPDNLLVDRDGSIWFGTDGNFGTNAGRSDAVYYLDLDPAHRSTPVPTYGKAFRVVAVPSDAEATGPSFTPDMRTLFVAVQHPGEERFSTWPQDR